MRGSGYAYACAQLIAIKGSSFLSERYFFGARWFRRRRSDAIEHLTVRDGCGMRRCIPLRHLLVLHARPRPRPAALHARHVPVQVVQLVARFDRGRSRRGARETARQTEGGAAGEQAERQGCCRTRLLHRTGEGVAQLEVKVIPVREAAWQHWRDDSFPQSMASSSPTNVVRMTMR
jgi:hypothetical protein